MQSKSRRYAVVLVTFLMLSSLPLASPWAEATEKTHPDLVEWIDLSPMPAEVDIMNDEIPQIVVLGDDLVFLWETDHTHWPNPDGTQPIELPENEDVQVRFLRDGKLTSIFNVSSEGTIPQGYGHRPRMVVYDGRLHVNWNSHAWSSNGAFSVVLRVYDPATDTWDAPRTLVDAPDGGIMAGGAGAVHGERLWYAWQGRIPVDPNSTEADPGIDVYARWFDGQSWGPVVDLSEGMPGADTEPSLVSSGGRLHVAWGHDDPDVPGNADIHHRILDPGGEWGPLLEGIGGGSTRNDKKVKLVDWNGTPVMLWQSDGINQRGKVYSDVMLCMYIDGAWTPPRVVNPPGRYTGNVVPKAVPHGDLLYVAWSTGDDGISIGTDLDVVMRDFDGERFGDIVVLSPDDTDVKDNPCDDGSVDLVVYQGNIWAVFDAIFSPVTDGPDKDILLRYVGFDFDQDGAKDSVDAFPRDPNEQADSDGDGVGDNADAYPYDRDRWEREDGDGSSGPDFALAAVSIALVAVAVASLVALLVGRNRQQPDTED